MKLSSVASSVLTKSGRQMIDALIAGQRDPTVLAEMAKGKMRAKIPDLQDALAGRFNAHHALLCRAMLARIDQADATIDELTKRIEELLDPHKAAVTLLVGIPGVPPASPEPAGAQARTGAHTSAPGAERGGAQGAFASRVAREIRYWSLGGRRVHDP